MSHLSSIRNLFRCFIAAAAFMYGGANAVPAYASLVLTIDNYTTNQLAFTISGTFEEDTIGNYPGYIAVKNNWSGNAGTHTELWTDDPAIQSNTLTIGGSSGGSLVTSSEYFGDAFSMINPAGSNVAITAGTAVTGSVVLFGLDKFNPVANNSIQLVSGFDTVARAWMRLEADATVVPIPGALWLLSSGLIGIVGIRKKFKK